MIDEIIKLQTSIHSRVAVLLIKAKNKYKDTQLIIKKNGKTAKGNSLLEYLSLQALKGQEINILIKGQYQKQLYTEVYNILTGKVK